MPIGETTLTIIGNLTKDPELTRMSDGTARCAFTVASNPRTYDANAGEWRPGNALFMRCTAWRTLGEHVAESLHKGLRVVVTGTLRQFEIDTPDGVRSGYGLDVEDIGPSLRWATTDVHRTESRTATAPATAGKVQEAAAPLGNPWQMPATPAAPGAGGSDAPPF